MDSGEGVFYGWEDGPEMMSDELRVSRHGSGDGVTSGT